MQLLRLSTALALVGAATAFAPAPRAPRAAAPALQAKGKKIAFGYKNTVFENEVGALPPLGFWDPMAVTLGASQERFDRLREVELKHGRVSMLAILGHIATASGMRWDAAYDAAGHTFKEVPAGLAAFSKIGGPGLQWIILTVGVLEIGFYECKDDVAADYEARMDKMGWTDAKKRSKKNIEINNGRAAMMGILGLMVHEQINNDPYVLNAILGAPVRFNELYGA